MFKIKKLIAQKVHGYIPMNLSFNTDLTFLTGSNGCGKTTALKLISALLQPDFDIINNISFASVQLDFWHKNQEISVVITKDTEPQIANWSITFNDRKNKKKDSKVIGNKFMLYPQNIDYSYSSDELNSQKEIIRSKFFESEFFKTIDSLGSPILLGIDRKIVGKVQDKRIFRRNLRRSYVSGISDISFLHAQQEVIEYVSSNAEMKKILVESLKANIFRTLFKYVSFKNVSEGYRHIDKKQLKKKKYLTISAVQRLDLGDEILEEIEGYFSNIEKLQRSLKDESIEGDQKQIVLNEWWANRPHLSRIELVSEYAEKYQKEIDKLDYPLVEITKIANSFFDESNKSLRIGANGQIHVDWTDKDITTSNLSSGEIQLIVIIIHLVFCEFEKDHSVFVIDEPELSLHLSWQEKFIDAITTASPGTQFILATHSPAIISKLEYEKKCIVMKNA